MIPTPRAKDTFVRSNQGDLSFYLENYFGNAQSGVADVTETLQRLPSNPCRFVLLANWNATDDVALSYTALSGDTLYENAGDEIYYGFGRIVTCQLFPSQNSGLLPVNNTDLICFFNKNGSATSKLYYTWFW